MVFYAGLWHLQTAAARGTLLRRVMTMLPVLINIDRWSSVWRSGGHRGAYTSVSVQTRTRTPKKAQRSTRCRQQISIDPCQLTLVSYTASYFHFCKSLHSLAISRRHHYTAHTADQEKSGTAVIRFASGFFFNTCTINSTFS